MTYAKIIADSISDQGHRLTTFEVRFHRFVLAEFNTHRVFSRNSESSRAVPSEKKIERIVNDPAIPVRWAAEQSGMQGGDEIADVKSAEENWKIAGRYAIEIAENLAELGVHKSITNRLLEPFMWHTVIVTSTAWDNFFQQRVSPLAQPEINAAASLMLEEYERSTPEYLEEGEWHLPYIREEDADELHDREGVPVLEHLRRISCARCARVSYLTHDGVRSLEKDLELYDRLVSASPMHASPLEHVATPDSWNVHFVNIERELPDGQLFTHQLTLPKVGNLVGWKQHRLDVELERGIYSYG